VAMLPSRSASLQEGIWCTPRLALLLLIRSVEDNLVKRSQSRLTDSADMGKYDPKRPTIKHPLDVTLPTLIWHPNERSDTGGQRC
jgi:hypothetical protein